MLLQCPVYDIKLHLMVKALVLEFGKWDLFITITLRSTLTLSGSICKGPIYESNRTVQSFIKDHYY